MKRIWEEHSKLREQLKPSSKNRVSVSQELTKGQWDWSRVNLIRFLHELKQEVIEEFI